MEEDCVLLHGLNRCPVSALMAEGLESRSCQGAMDERRRLEGDLARQKVRTEKLERHLKLFARENWEAVLREMA